MHRRQFLMGSLGLAGITILFQTTGCSTSTEPEVISIGGDGGSGGFSVNSSSAGGHTHNVTISFSHINDPPTASITLTSDGSHTHQITLTNSDFQDLAAGETVVKTSTSNNGHTHAFSITVPA